MTSEFKARHRSREQPLKLLSDVAESAARGLRASVIYERNLTLTQEGNNNGPNA